MLEIFRHLHPMLLKHHYRLEMFYLWGFLISTAILYSCDSGEAELHSTPQESTNGIEVVASFDDAEVEVVESQPTDGDASVSPSLSQIGAQSGGVLSVYSDFCETPDPAIDSAFLYRGTLSMPMVAEIHMGLMSISDDPNSPFQPALAERYSVRENGTIYEFILRQDLKFSDGSPLTASDFKWSWERALKMSTGWGQANKVFANIAGAEEVANGATDDLYGVEVVDDRTLIIRLKREQPGLPALLADPVASVLKQENIKQWTAEWNNNDPSITVPLVFDESNLPVGAGPFKLSEYAITFSNENCALKRNEHYWGQKTYLDGVRYVTGLAPDIGASTKDVTDIRNEAFISGLIDYTNLPSDAENIEYPTVDIQTASSTGFLVFNSALPPLDDVHFRRALIAASDLSAMLQTEEVAPSTRLLPPSLRTNGLIVPNSQYDPELALSEISMSAYASEVSDFEIKFHTVFTTFLMDAYSKLFDQWKELLELKVVHVDIASIYEFETYLDSLNSGSLQMRQFAVAVNYPDPYSVFSYFVSAFGEGNSSPEFLEVERMLKEANEQQDAARLRIQYEMIEQHILEQALAMPVFQYETVYQIKHKPWIRGLNMPRYLGSMFKDIWIDESHTQYPQP